jgi:hypothetical protein
MAWDRLRTSAASPDGVPTNVDPEPGTDELWPEHHRCPSCGLVYDLISLNDAVVAARSYPRRYRDALAHPDEADDPVWERIITSRPARGVWSAVEYTGHVVQTVAIWRERLERVLVDDDVVFPMIDVDAAVAAADFNARGAAEVLDELDHSIALWAGAIEHLRPSQLERTFRRLDRPRTVRWITRHVTHDGSHHLRDVPRVIGMIV